MDSTVLQALLIVSGSTLLAVAGLLAVARFVPDEVRASDHDAKSAFLSMAGVSYAILLAFVVVAVWSDFTDAAKTSEEEVTRLADLMRDTGPFPAAARVPMRRSVLAYADAVVRLEWRSMADGEADPVAVRRYEEIWAQWYRYSPRGATPTTFYSESVARLNDLGVDRRERLITSRASVPAVMWALLLIGFVISIAFTYQFKMERLSIHLLSVAATAALTGFVLFLIFALQHPFAGDVAISSSPWSEFLDSWAGRPL
jgi:hypothetical protein